MVKFFEDLRNIVCFSLGSGNSLITNNEVICLIETYIIVLSKRDLINVFCYNIIYDADLKYWSEPSFKKNFLSSSRNLVDISAVLLYIFAQALIKRLCLMNIKILKKVKMMCYCENFIE